MKIKIIGLSLASIIVLSGCTTTNSPVPLQETVISEPQETVIAEQQETEKTDNGQAIELELQQISNSILAQNYSEANTKIMNSRFFKEHPSYSVLQNYAYALLQQQQKKKKNQALYIEYLFKIPEEYSGVLSDQIKESQINVLDDLLGMVKRGKYAQAVDETTYSVLRDGSDERISAIHYYATAKYYESKKDTSTVASYLLKIDGNYNGLLVDDITKMKEKYNSEIRETIKYEVIAAERAAKKEPAIGMTAQEVEDSKWGSPDDINKTTTKYGISEQWVYKYHGYIYLDDGIVTAIQE
ncbi:hypothetical protein [Cohnella boryungensis]|uniref:Lipoprotein n=1 Tax=Cohnella boryungensis TaxID=768479 RepID=A0ABV8SIE9_9BACL